MKLPRPEPRRLALCVLSACGMVLSCPDYDQFWLGFLMWIPYFAAIEGCRPRAAFGYGWLVGTITVFWGFNWLSELLTKFAGFPYVGALPVTLLFAMWHGLIWGGAALLITWARARRPNLPLVLVAPVCWVAMEAVLPNIFPIYMAHGWCWQPLLMQTAELGGVTTVSAVMVATNAALYTLGRARLVEHRVDRRAAIAAVVLLVGNPLYGAIRIAQVQAQMEEAPKLVFGVVQGNMSIRQMANPETRVKILAGQQEMTAKLQAEGAQVALWGETSYPNGKTFHRKRTEDLPPNHPWRVRRGFDIPIVFGAVTRDPTGAEPYPFNTAILLDENGFIAGKYDKVYRLMFGEYAPLVDPQWYLKMVPSASHIAEGPGPGTLSLGPWKLGPFICYEDILPRYVRQSAKQGVNVFVNLTNDAWFGKTHEPAEHLGLAVFRAVEHRKPMVRAVNTGVSVYIDPIGAAHHKTRVTDPDTEGFQAPDGFTVEVPMMDADELTLYGWTGEGFNGLCVLGTLWLVWPRRRSRVPATA
jgi:apolipoprotein N-acyltransferase